MVAPRWFVHANVNTTDLAAARRFYVDGLGLSVSSTTSPTVPQNGAALGIPSDAVHWEGLMLADHRGARGPMVDLIEWTQPRTAAALPGAGTGPRLGLVALQFTVADLDGATHALGGAATPIGDEVAMVATDPDGTSVELRPGPFAVRFCGVRVNCSNLASTARFWSAAFGLAAGPVRVAPDGALRTQRLVLPGRPDDFAVELTERVDLPAGEPPPAGGHEAGIYRVAVLVDGLDEARRELLELVPDLPPPAELDVGAHFPTVRALCFRDGDGTTLEYIERVARPEPGPREA